MSKDKCLIVSDTVPKWAMNSDRAHSESTYLSKDRWLDFWCVCECVYRLQPCSLIGSPAASAWLQTPRRPISSWQTEIGDNPPDILVHARRELASLSASSLHLRLIILVCKVYQLQIQLFWLCTTQIGVLYMHTP